MNESTYLSIKKFSQFTGVRQSTLRYYDEIGLLPPAGRGENNYRYYVPFQIITLGFINVLVDIGVPLSTIKKMTKERTPENVIELLSRQESRLDYRLNSLRTAYSIVHTYRDNIQEALQPRKSDIVLEELDETRLILGPETDFDDSESFYETFMDFCNSAPNYGINPRYPIGAFHENMDVFIGAPGQPQRFFSLDPLGNYIQKKGQYLCGYNRGYYGQFGDTADKMAAYAADKGLTFSGPVFVVYLLDEISVVEPDQYLSKIMAGVSHKKTERRP